VDAGGDSSTQPRRGSVGSASHAGGAPAPETARSETGGQTHRGAAEGSTSGLRVVVGAPSDTASETASGAGSPTRTQRGGALDTPKADGGFPDALLFAAEALSMGTRERLPGSSTGGGSSIGGGDRDRTASVGAAGGFGGSRGPSLQMLVESLGLDDQIDQLLKISALADQEWEEALAPGSGGVTPH
jgi:hypothetical protein